MYPNLIGAYFNLNLIVFVRMFVFYTAWTLTFFVFLFACVCVCAWTQSVPVLKGLDLDMGQAWRGDMIKRRTKKKKIQRRKKEPIQKWQAFYKPYGKRSRHMHEYLLTYPTFMKWHYEVAIWRHLLVEKSSTARSLIK